MTWKHVVLVIAGAAVAVAGVMTGSGAVLVPIATTIIGGAVGHAQGDKTP